MTNSKAKQKCDIKIDSMQLEKEAMDYIEKFTSQMRRLADETIGDIEANLLPHIEGDAWTNYREQLRLELEREYKYSRFKDEWAINFRRAVFVENRDEMAKLIAQDILVKNKQLEDRCQEFDQFRYSPGGDRYIDKCKQLDQALEQADKLAEALRFYADPLSKSDINNDYEYTARQALTAFEQWKSAANAAPRAKNSSNDDRG